MVATTVTSIFLNQDDRVPDDSRGKLFLVESRFLEKKSVSEIYQTPDLKKLRNFKKTGENLVGSRFFGLPNAPSVLLWDRQSRENTSDNGNFVPRP